MNYSNLFKQLKRRLRLRKRWLSLGAYLLLAGGAAAAWYGVGELSEGKRDIVPVDRAVVWLEPSDKAGDPPNAEDILSGIVGSGGKREVEVHKHYVCGEETEQMGLLSAEKIVQLVQDNPSAVLRVDDTGKVHLTEEIEDLAPRCKENAYFGLDRNGNLTLFDGVPEQEKVIRTFFQLDVEQLRSSLPIDAVEQLYTGIPIGDIGDYNSVLSTFSDYALDRAEPVSKPSS